MKAYEGVAKALIAEGTDVVFVLMAVDNMDLIVELKEKYGVKVVTVRNEHGAVAMADGYARATGRPGVCIVSEGPGLLQTGMALTTARRKRSPVVMIATDAPHSERLNIKRFNQEAYIELIAGKVYSLRTPQTVAEDMQLVFRHVRSGRGPAVLNAPVDIMEGTSPDSWDYKPVVPVPRKLHPDPLAIAQAADLLSSAHRPVLLAGRGAFTGGAGPEMETLAERIGALLGTTIQARGYFDGNPYGIGLVGGFSRSPVPELLANSDCVVAVGTSLNPYITGFGSLFGVARVIHIDADAERIGDALPTEVGVVADARIAVAALNERLEQAGFLKREGYRTAEVRDRLASMDRTDGPYLESPDKLDIRQVLADLDELLPRERQVVTDAGHSAFFVPDHLSVPAPDALIWSNDFAALNHGVPMGVGAAMGRQDRHTVVIVGDGGLMMNPAELETAVRYRLPLTVVVMNDEAYGAELHVMRNKGLPIDLSLFGSPDFAALARSFGADGVTARTRAELAAAASRVGQGDRPLLIDIRINPEVKHRLWSRAKRLSGGK